MPAIRASADLRNKYSEISTYCHTTNQPVFITKNGQGDLAVMSITQYDQLLEKVNLYSKLAEGLKDIQEGRSQSFDSAMKEISWRICSRCSASTTSSSRPAASANPVPSPKPSAASPR